MGDLLASVVPGMGLSATDSEGRGVTYAARVRGQSLAESDRVGDVLAQDDVVMLTRNVTAGGGPRR